MPEEDGFRDSPPPLPDGYDDDVRYWGDPLDDHFADRGTVPALPPVPATVLVAPGDSGIAKGSGRPPPGLLDVSVPWAALVCQSPAPGMIGRIGPVTATQARQLARLALTSHTTQWLFVHTERVHRRRIRRMDPHEVLSRCQTWALSSVLRHLLGLTTGQGPESEPPWLSPPS